MNDWQSYNIMDKFKKNKQRWMEEFTQGVSKKMPLRQPLDPPDPSKPNFPLFQPKAPKYIKQYTFESKPHQRTLTPPELLLSFDPGLAAKILDKSVRSRYSIQGTLLADGPNTCIDRMQELSSEEEETLGSLQQSKEAFCIGLSVVKEDGYAKTQQRVEHDFRCLYERSGHQLAPEDQQGRISDLWRKLSRLIRVFILVEEREKRLKIGRLMFYPKAELSLRKVKMHPCSFVMSPPLKKLGNFNFSEEVLYGYVAITRNESDSFKLVLLDPQEYYLMDKPVPLLGIFIFGRLGSKQDTLLWASIMDYLITPLVTKRISVKGERTGLLIHFEERSKQTNYLFQVPASARWTVASSIEQAPTFSTEHRLSTRQVIMEEDKEESEVQSVQSRPNFPEFPTDTLSSRSNDEKDLQIAALKKELEIYKNHCEELKEVIKSLTRQNTVIPHAPVYQMQYPLVQSYPSISEPQLPSFKEEPHFGQTPSQQPTQLSKSKQFRVKDNKGNFSFAAHENSLDQEQTLENLLANSINDQPLQSPQFNGSFGSNLPSRQIRSFEEERRQERPAMIPNSMKKTISQPERMKVESPRNMPDKYRVPLKQEQLLPESQKKGRGLVSEEKKQITAITSKYTGKNYSEQRGSSEKDLKPKAINRLEPSSPSSPRNLIISKETRNEQKDEKKGQPVAPKPIRHIQLDSDQQEDEDLKRIMQRYSKKK